jgi:hypothetical protein
MTENDSFQNPVLQSVYLSLLEILGSDQPSGLFKEQGINHELLPKGEVNGDVADLIDRIGDSLNRDFGQMAAQGLLIRAGRASLTFFRRFFPQVADLGSLENRLKPVGKRFFHSLESLADLWSRETGVISKLEQVDQGEFKWIMTIPTAKGEMNHTIFPFFLFGLLEEFCVWLDARKSYRIVYLPAEKAGLVELSISIQPQD